MSGAVLEPRRDRPCWPRRATFPPPCNKLRVPRGNRTGRWHRPVTGDVAIMTPAQKPEPGELFTSVEVILSRVTKPICQDLLSFQKRGRNPETDPLSISSHPAAGGTVPLLPQLDPTEHYRPSPAAWARCPAEGQSGDSRNVGNVLCTKRSTLFSGVLGRGTRRTPSACYAVGACGTGRGSHSSALAAQGMKNMSR